MDSGNTRRRTKNKNWNIFAGDLEYRTDHFLRFLSPFTATKYRKDRFQRLFFQARAFVTFSGAAWSFLYLYANALSLLNFALGIVCLICCYRSISTKHSPFTAKLFYLSLEYLFQSALSVCDLPIFLTFFNIPTFFADMLFVYEWYKHAFISLGLLLAQSLANDFNYPVLLYQFLVISGTTTLFGYVEKEMKEDWVLYDSFKKSLNLVRKFTDTSPCPMFVVDSFGKIVDKNAKGRALLKFVRRPTNFSELLHPSCRDHFISMFKRTLKEKSCQFDVLIRIPSSSCPPNNNYTSKCYDSYRLHAEVIAWKAMKCVVLACHCTKGLKTAYEAISKNEQSAMQRAKLTCDELEKYVLKTARKQEYMMMIYNTKQIFYNNAHSYMAIAKLNESYKSDLESFDIKEYVNYIMDIHNIPAHNKGVILTLKTDPSFPKEITGEKIKFEIVVSAILTFLINNTENGKGIVLEAKLRSPIEDGLLLGFDFRCPISQHVNIEEMEMILGTAKEGEDFLSRSDWTEHYGLCLIQCKHLVKWLKGSIEVSPATNSNIGIYIDIPFSNYDNTKLLECKKSLGFFQVRRLSKYASQWEEKPVLIRRETVEEEKSSFAQAAGSDIDKISVAAKSKIKILSEARDKSCELMKERLLKNCRMKSTSVVKDIEVSSVLRSRTPEHSKDSSFQQRGSGSISNSRCENPVPEPHTSPSQDYVCAQPFAQLKPAEDVLYSASFHEAEIDESFSPGNKMNKSCELRVSVSQNPNPKHLGDMTEVRLASQHKSAHFGFHQFSPSVKRRTSGTRGSSQSRNDWMVTQCRLNVQHFLQRQSPVTSAYQKVAIVSSRRKAWKKAVARRNSDREDSKENHIVKVLIVDDNDFNIVPIRTTLKRNNVSYDVAKNGLMALERYNQAAHEGATYGVVLMDVEMPVMDGYEATAEIRKAEQLNGYPRTFICGLSGYGTKVEKKCLDCGMDQYFSKPINMERMMSLIREQLSKQGNA